jgi:hypothetical protein
MADIDFSSINGVDYGYSSIALTASGVPFPLTGLKDFSYKDNLKPGKARGTNAQVKRRSRGQYDADGSLTWYKSAWGIFLQQIAAQAATIGLGYKELVFKAVISYNEIATGLQTDYLHDLRITEDSDTHSEDDGVLMHKCTLDILQINWNGVAPFSTATYPSENPSGAIGPG